MLYSRIEFKAISYRCENVSFKEIDEEYYWLWEKPKTKKNKVTISDHNKSEFMSDTFCLLRDYSLSDFDASVYSSYLMKWGSLFYSPKERINAFNVVMQSGLVMHIEHLLYYIKRKEMPDLLSDLFKLWEADIYNVQTGVDRKYWVLVPPFENEDYQWLPSARIMPNNQFFLYIIGPSEENFQEMIENEEFKYSYFKMAIMKNIEAYLNKYIRHKITLDGHGNTIIEGTCTSLLAYYIFNNLEKFGDNVETCTCGKPLSGRQRLFCSKECKDRFYNNSEAKRVDRWINKMAYDKKITKSKSEKLRNIAKDQFRNGENEKIVREIIKDNLDNI
jgi:hypothetical protein